MLDLNKFTVSLRTKTGKSANRKMRADRGAVASNPGVVYGVKKPVNVYMRSDRAMRFIKEKAKSDNKQFDLEITDAGKNSSTKKVIVQDYQLSPVGNRLLHIDFREVSAKSIITTDVPIRTVGVSKAAKLGGLVQIIRHSIQVKGQVDKIPPYIEVDISDLDFRQSIHVSQLVLPKGIEPTLAKDDDFAIITVSTATKEEEPVVEASEKEASETTDEEPKEDKEAKKPA